MIIRTATAQDIPTIHRLAREIWWPTYQDFIRAEQISFMLDTMYSEQALAGQAEEGIVFLLAERDRQAIAFAGYFLSGQERVCKLHKLYILPSEQGKGTGSEIIKYVADLARLQGMKILELNVNRNNPAFGFYRKLGFEIFQSVDTLYYQFELNDYVMRVDLDEQGKLQ